MKSFKWNIIADDSQPKEKSQTLVQSVINARGLKGSSTQIFQEESTAFFSPFLLKDMQKAVDIVSNAIESGILICVYGDYDCDGVCATTMMHHYLESSGARVFYYIPHREKEGYGLNNLAIDEISRLGATLIITVDNGVSAIEEIAYAHSIGIEVVVTDHHTPREELPMASAIINPHQKDCDYPFKDLCGAGVAFKLLCALEGEEGFGLIEQYGDLLAIATVADIVPLLSENRSIIKEGLPLIQNSFRPGLKVLLENAKLAEREITSDSIAFGLAPRINAAGRIDSADTAVMLLSTESDEEAQELGNVLEQLNLQRRELEKVIVDDIAQSLEQDPTISYKKIPVFSGVGWNAGVVGIVCSRLSERFGRPVLIASIDEDGGATGSGRSIADFSLIKAITYSSGTLERYGGHPMAAGFSLKASDISQFSEDLNDYCTTNYKAMPTPVLTVDVALSPKQLTVEEVDSLRELEPFGCGNEHPVFCVKSAKIIKIISLSQGKHLKLQLSAMSKQFEVLLFFTQEETLGFSCGDVVDIAFSVSINEYQSVKSVSMKCLSIRLSEIDYDKVISERQYYESYKLGSEKTLSKDLIPTREQAGAIYRYLKTKPVIFSEIDSVYYHLKKEKEIDYSSFRIAVDVLIELSHLIIENKALKVNVVAPKSDFNLSSTIRRLSNND